MAGLTDLAMRILIGAEDRTGPAIKTARQGVQSISDQLQKVETIAKRFLDIRLFAGWTQDGIILADAYKGLTGSLPHRQLKKEKLTNILKIFRTEVSNNFTVDSWLLSTLFCTFLINK